MTPPPLSRAELRRYSRPLLVPEWAEAGAQEKLRSAQVLVVGAGGLGGPVIRQLAGAGVGALTIADSDTVSLSNLHRQLLFDTGDVGRPKAEVACAAAQRVNPFVEVRAAPALTPDNAADLIAGHDLTVDATDNFDSRYLIADTCGALGREWVWGAASGVSGLCSVFGPHLGLREVFPTPEADSCDELGVLGPVPNMVGGMMALQALLVLGGVGEPLRGRLWTFDALTGRVRVIRVGSATPR
ncbi:adenylyltransferase and sulfurtransferase [Deinococcus reticulitermitis]|uniref:Adenylyltransferase and sulfurtransferase n=1 Tax=Deinococcus reticulitermitis TaxID=856736 RepID=A0A1H7BDJ0_9DEIO|nr:HesA/MoeB/ThiF family protein [Deinococcus reticulitermitis]SEJ75713.1 adenylyltransferase and sulfurtransferase [Deinococcus reticulitermitis]